MRTLKLTLAYDGTAYAGWQLQARGPTLQGALEAALARITGAAIRVSASGRTDAGVHALGQVVSFRTDSALAPAMFFKALSAELPRDMAVLEIADVDDAFHARRSAVAKRYRYVIHDNQPLNVFERNYVWQVRRRLDEAAMHRAAQALVGEHDFASFQTSGSPRATTVRNVRELVVRRVGQPPCDHVVLEIEADGFLYNMVRSIVGTLWQIGRGVESKDWLGRVLAACDRQSAGQNAPAAGLYLVEVTYPS